MGLRLGRVLEPVLLVPRFQDQGVPLPEDLDEGKVISGVEERFHMQLEQYQRTAMDL